MKITCATYNILHGYFVEEIGKNIKALAEKADILCIQEAEIPVEDYLPENWQIEYFHNTRGCNLAIAWNASKFTLKQSKKFLLPKSFKFSLLKRMIDMRDVERGVLSAVFSGEGKDIRITNIHLAWENGGRQRIKQLEYLLRDLSESDVNGEILVGDFNTFNYPLFQRFEEKKIEGVLSGWANVFQGIPWTCDTSYSDPKDGVEKFVKILRIFKIKFRCRMDYIFSKNLEVISKEMLDVPGSDHRPLVATFEI